MVGSYAFAGMIFQLLISILLPTALLIYWRIKGKFSWRVFWAGVGVFIIFAQILEGGLHAMMIDPSGPSLKMTDNPFAYALYGGLAAALFEELGRYFVFLLVLKRSREFGDGVSLGIGHGGIEAVLIGAVGAVNALVYAIMINNGTFETNLSVLPSQQISQLKMQIIETNFGSYLLAGIERAGAIVMQIMFSVMVLLGVRSGKFKYVLYAIGLHLFIDFFVALYQVGTITSIWIIEGLVAAFALLSIYIIRQLKLHFK
ncbi:YhfC family intramembrane metalloprotease [Pseudobacillus sp. FSL P4-0506]|uniref:YhfC family intramembrane metalloprotease n=1 Tax=Pseudobacillus sp. FSL P4-0506 TaxID=2921576 RepID=UPI0030FAAD90